ncbi:Alpha-tubulin suppressor [Thermanaeromonas toyohensis ToBE]|uniref:Alpha-tubulin suppressor n=2 Tax=Thermanaeromonas TaxID=202949 RepID=A0A1W1VTD6_9FIRM|nr:Alpha-tubulin suppressor [Thermanaeromonas toyohensis ToBE]
MTQGVLWATRPFVSWVIFGKGVNYMHGLSRKVTKVSIAVLLALFMVLNCFSIVSLQMAYASVVQPMISAGTYHSLALKSDGTVWAWGQNSYGQLGDGTTTNRYTPVQVQGLSDVVAVAAGGGHSLALKSDGTVWAWGANNYGQLGDGTTANRYTPVQVQGLSGVVAIAAALGSHSLALKSDGTVWAWGYNYYGQLGDGTTTNRYTPVQVQGLSNVVAIAAGGSYSLALKSDGTVCAWGYNGQGQLGDGTTTNRYTPVQVQNQNLQSSVVAIATHGNHSLALKSDGTVWAWGANAYGQLGDGTTTNRLTPVQVWNLSGVVAIAGGGNHSLALKSDGTVWAWGYNGAGQLGDGTTISRYTPVQVQGLSGVVAVAGGSNHSLALKSDGTVWAWGQNGYGQLGDGTTTNRTTPVQVLNLNLGPWITSITVTPSPVNLPKGRTQQLTVVANYSDGSSQDVTSSATYSSMNPSVASVSSSGLVTAVNTGSTAITVSYGSLSTQVPVTVTAAVVDSLTITPSSVTLPKGGTQQLTVTANYSDGSSQDVTGSASYSSSNPSVATVSSSGLISAVEVGSAAITVSYGGKTSEVPVQVTAAQGGPLISEINVLGGVAYEVNGREVWYVNSDIVSIEISFVLSGTYHLRYDPGNGSWLGWYTRNGSGVVETVVLAKGIGANLVRIEAEKDGNTDYRELIIVVDQVSPSILKLRGFRGATATSDPSGTAILEINVTDNLPGQLYYQYQINGGIPSSWFSLTGGTISIPGLSPGANSITVNVKDQVGNVSSATITIFRI